MSVIKREMEESESLAAVVAVLVVWGMIFGPFVLILTILSILIEGIGIYWVNLIWSSPISIAWSWGLLTLRQKEPEPSHRELLE